MKSVRQLRFAQQNYWKHQYAVIIMSHTKAGYSIVRALLDMGMFVVAVSSQFKQNEIMRHVLNKQQERHFLTKQVDLHRIMSINMLIMELKLEANKVKLFLCLVPQIDDDEKNTIFAKTSAALLQTILEVDNMSAGALCAIASRHIIEKDYSHMWTIRFHHQRPELVYDYLEYLIPLAERAPHYLNVKLIRNNKLQSYATC